MLLDQVDALTAQIDRLTVRIDELIAQIPVAAAPAVVQAEGARAASTWPLRRCRASPAATRSRGHAEGPVG